jgi:hypothetical protein
MQQTSFKVCILCLLPFYVLSIFTRCRLPALSTVPIDVQPEYKPQSQTKMKALAWFGNNRDIHLIELDVPDITEPDNATHVTDTTICGSDLHIYKAIILDMGVCLNCVVSLIN